MKMNNFALVLSAAALMPVTACADEVVASFERDLQRSFTVAPAVAVVQTRHDPLHIVNHILNREPDTVAASFDRGFYRQSANFAVAIAREADPLDAINIAFRHVESNTVLASFQLGLYREGVHAEALPVRYDDPLRAINVALWQEMGDEPVVHLLAGNSYY